MFEYIRCYWTTGHCYHPEVGSHRKVKNPEVECAVAGDYWKYRYRGTSNFIMMETKRIDQCCFCHKRKITSEHVFADLEYNKVMRYPDIDDEPLEL